MRALLEVNGVSTGYGDLPVVRDGTIRVHEGTVVTIVGANGAGKSTLLKAVTGSLPCWSGSINFDGRDITNVKAHHRPSLGLVMVPEGRRLFPFLSVQDNLLVGASAVRGAARSEKGDLERVFALFPILADRRSQMAGTMSGGEQQMCAIARALMAKPKLLILDEPSLGLAPIIVEKMLGMVRDLAEEGLTVLLVEQNVHDALELAAYGYVLEQGQIAIEGSGAELLARPDLQAAYMGI